MTHTPPHPAGPAGDRNFIDLVPGEPPVGHTVWRTPTGDDASPVPPRLAYRLIAAFTTVGDTVVDLTDSPTVAACAAAGARTYARAAFGDNRSIRVVAIMPPAPRARQGRAVTAGEPPEITDWFGDDLRDPDRPTGTVTDTPVEPASATATAPTLLVAMWPLHPAEPDNTDRLTDLMAAAANVLSTDGCVAFIAAHGSGGEYTALTDAAYIAGLDYFQHIVAVRAEAGAERFTYHLSDADLATLEADGHVNIHTDVVVFTIGGGRR